MTFAKLVVVASAGAALAALALLGSRRPAATTQKTAAATSSNAATSSAARPPRELHVPWAGGEIHLDGELEEADWKRAARTGTFVDAVGREATPFSEARFLWKDGRLLLGLYAADQDIRSAPVEHDGPVWNNDSFHVVFSVDGAEYSVDVGPTGIVADSVRRRGGTSDRGWESGAKLACDSDGTVDHEGDMDEEWVVEMSLPLESIGVRGEAGQRVEMRIRRCDGAQGTPARRCSDAWPMVAVLDAPSPR